MSYLLALVGGVVIGLGAATLHVLIGRVAGISGIAGRVLSADPSERDWRSVFLIGLVFGGALMLFIAPGQFSTLSSEPSTLRLILAGLLVGFGTRLSCGCTSGHGVCGISRFSPRSFIATLTFIGAGVLTVALAS
tara:strand:- start:34438 stop:34842 length:405 start_codon:yes stop_codon:yes gene_type:complete